MDRLKFVSQHLLINLAASFTASAICFMISSSALAEEVTFESDVRVKRDTQNAFEPVKKGESLKLKAGESALVSTSQGASLLIFSAKNAKSQINVSDVDLNSLTQDQLQPSLERSTNDVIEGLRKADAQISKRDYDQALQTATALKSKYPRVSSVLFTSATANYLTNNKAVAIDDLQKGLAIDPNDVSAAKLLKKLKEGS